MPALTLALVGYGLERMLKMFKRTTGEGDSRWVKRKCIIGIDQSYKRTGIAICVDGTVKKVVGIDFKHTKSKTSKRIRLSEVLNKALDTCLSKYKPEEIAVVCERVRTFTNSNEIRPEVIKAQAAMVAYIVDTALLRGVDTFSADTRAWKNSVLGSSKAMLIEFPGVKNPQKIASVKKAIELGFEKEISSTKNRQKQVYYNDDMADAICISLFPFRPGAKLKKEF